MSNDVVQPVDEISPASEELKEWVMNIEARLDNSTEEVPPTGPPNEKIPSIFGNWKRLDDHFQNVPFLREINMWQFVAYMKSYNNLNVQSYLEDLQEKEDDLWSYYEGVDEEFRAENGKRFIEYLLANSCFLIFALVILPDHWEVLEKKFQSDENDDSKLQTLIEFGNLKELIRGQVRGIWRYMLTMDYQIPWFVVEAVYTKHSNVSSKLNTPIHELVISVFNFIHPRVPNSELHNDTITVPQYGFQHLLHIFHWSRTPKGKFREINRYADMKSLDIPSATYLQSCAITVFNKHDTSGFDVTFYEGILSGVVQLPRMSHFLYESEIYKDLLAFERGYGRVCGFSITFYIACIVFLVQTAEDVSLLRVNGLLPIEIKDLLSSVQGYKTILLSNDIPVPHDLLRMELKMKSYTHKRTSTKKYYADFKGRYCRNPWITFSVVGGILLFFLTFIQTVLSFIQTKYSVLSYKNQ